MAKQLMKLLHDRRRKVLMARAIHRPRLGKPGIRLHQRQQHRQQQQQNRRRTRQQQKQHPDANLRLLAGVLLRLNGILMLLVLRHRPVVTFLPGQRHKRRRNRPFGVLVAQAAHGEALMNLMVVHRLCSHLLQLKEGSQLVLFRHGRHSPQQVPETLVKNPHHGQKRQGRRHHRNSRRNSLHHTHHHAKNHHSHRRQSLHRHNRNSGKTRPRQSNLLQDQVIQHPEDHHPPEGEIQEAPQIYQAEKRMQWICLASAMDLALKSCDQLTKRQQCNGTRTALHGVLLGKPR
mmetsp:Transcript_75606/g.149435  ORF Transcript_75606/g.149435 Transcript_75606/m.149435 type:complete len:289 (+) Transcript_75606:1698-2564(+)